ncbi:hypothetical protein [Stakelama pacifica]|uniref:Uncharacterized protein n=1 Tax=Stakelama pacifica TaxID=517720 RepID=A0A4R6FN71_9SPHN|nr:hypothetical protein [Stakelama pacifica]TDN82993.1 hypothetical protein EV664_105191 [Stakelama pacifica]GGO94981.1 hypothetical protein GCM10011329_18090 [Stakelama pacifica]
MTQLDLFAAATAPAIRRPVKPHGKVVQGEVDETLTLPHPRMAWHRARIELHRHHAGLWMWSTSWQAVNSGRSYRVGEKWGKFAESRDAALFHAVQEMRGGIGIEASADARAILAWLDTLR